MKYVTHGYQQVGPERQKLVLRSWGTRSGSSASTRACARATRRPGSSTSSSVSYIGNCLARRTGHSTVCHCASRAGLSQKLFPVAEASRGASARPSHVPAAQVDEMWESIPRARLRYVITALDDIRDSRISSLDEEPMACRIRKQSRQRSRAREGLRDWLYAWRLRNDFSQSEAAMKLQISTRTLQEWEQGRARPRGLALGAISKLIRSTG